MLVYWVYSCWGKSVGSLCWVGVCWVAAFGLFASLCGCQYAVIVGVSVLCWFHYVGSLRGVSVYGEFGVSVFVVSVYM